MRASVFDMPASIKFYCEGLGFELVSSDGKPAPHFDWALLQLNGTELMLNTAYDEDQRPPTPDPGFDLSSKAANLIPRPRSNAPGSWREPLASSVMTSPLAP